MQTQAYTPWPQTKVRLPLSLTLTSSTSLTPLQSREPLAHRQPAEQAHILYLSTAIECTNRYCYHFSYEIKTGGVSYGTRKVSENVGCPLSSLQECSSNSQLQRYIQFAVPYPTLLYRCWTRSVIQTYFFYHQLLIHASPWLLYLYTSIRNFLRMS